jgi:hypothetical protein
MAAAFARCALANDFTEKFRASLRVANRSAFRLTLEACRTAPARRDPDLRPPRTTFHA